MMTVTSDVFERYHPFWMWEEVAHNMWGNVSDKSQWLQRAIAFTGDAALYGSWMFRVADAWRYSCEHHLTKMETNRKPWIGHAAVAMAMQCPEDIVREAWGYLTTAQQDAANAQAQAAIDYWERTHA